MHDVFKSLKIVLIDTEEGYRGELADYLRSRGYCIIGSLYNTDALGSLLRPPDIVIISMWYTAALMYKTFYDVQAHYPHAKVIVYMPADARLLKEKSFNKGVAGYFFTDRTVDETNVLEVIDAVMTNQFEFPINANDENQFS